MAGLPCLVLLQANEHVNTLVSGSSAKTKATEGLAGEQRALVTKQQYKQTKSTDKCLPEILQEQTFAFKTARLRSKSHQQGSLLLNRCFRLASCTL